MLEWKQRAGCAIICNFSGGCTVSRNSQHIYAKYHVNRSVVVSRLQLCWGLNPIDEGPGLKPVWFVDLWDETLADHAGGRSHRGSQSAVAPVSIVRMSQNGSLGGLGNNPIGLYEKCTDARGVLRAD
jgi:hypothetical protein